MAPKISINKNMWTDENTLQTVQHIFVAAASYIFKKSEVT